MPLKRLNLHTFEYKLLFFPIPHFLLAFIPLGLTFAFRFSKEDSEGWGPPPLELFEKSIERLRKEKNSSVKFRGNIVGGGNTEVY